ncbi:MAG TPA: cobalamin-dependent protein [Verrucomicrobiota bacterium]|nr:cobalamin-dependent protein [Verrucomicrobiota bacterium]
MNLNELTSAVTKPSRHDGDASFQADLFLLHAPSVYDFRERGDVLFAYLSDSDSVNVTSIYEMYPIGFFAIQQRLRAAGFEAKIVNLASLMLMHPTLNVEKLLARLDAPIFGFDLHWMAQCHGAVEIAGRLKAMRPDATIIFGGISSTFYANELIRHNGVDVVVKGYDTLAPVEALVREVRRGNRNWDQIPNLIYKRMNSEVVDTGFTHKPSHHYNDETVDWSYYKDAKGAATTNKLIMTLPNTGCAMDCGWCGGSRSAYRNIMGVNKTLIQKDHRRIEDELRSLGEAARHTSIYALQCYSETKERMHQYLDAVEEMGYKNVSFEQFHLTPEDILRKMGRATNAYIMLSPESHDPVISKLAGRGTYTMEEMEAWIPRALDAGVAGIMVWFFLGMPRQTPESVWDTVVYCERLLKKFPGGKVLPLICPMVPFLDPGSRFFVEPEKNGYRIFHRTLDEHRAALVEPLWHRRLNYETNWLSRRQFQDVTYASIARLVTVKAELGLLPGSWAKSILETIDHTQRLLAEMETQLDVDGKLNGDTSNQVRAYNRKILAYSTDQIIPAPRPFGSRWYDDFTVPSNIINACCSNQNEPLSAMASSG